MNDERSVDDVIATIDVSVVTRGDFEQVIVNGDGEVIAGPFSSDEELTAAFDSFLTEEQIEALKIDAEVTYELAMEAIANRAIGYTA